MSATLRARAATLLDSGLGKVVLLLGDQGVVSGTNFLTTILIGRFAGKAELGLYSLAFTLYLAAMNFQTALISSAYIVYAPHREGDARRRYAGSVLTHQIALACLAGLVLLVAASALHWTQREPTLVPVIAVLGVATAFMLLKEFSRQISFADLRPLDAVLVDGLSAALHLGGLGALAAYGLLSSERVYLVIGAAWGVGGLLWLGARRRNFSPRRSDIVTDLAHNWRYTRWIAAQNVVYIASIQIFPWFLYTLRDEEANGILAACMGVLFFSNPFVLGLGNFIAPKTVHALKEEGLAGMNRFVNKALLFFGGSMGAFALLMIFGGELILTLLYGASYQGYGAVMGILGVSQWIWAVTMPTNYGLNALERPDVAFKSQSLAMVFTLTAGYYLVHRFGVAGVAGSYLANNTIMLLVARVAYLREVQKRKAVA